MVSIKAGAKIGQLSFNAKWNAYLKEGSGSGGEELCAIRQMGGRYGYVTICRMAAILTIRT